MDANQQAADAASGIPGAGSAASRDLRASAAEYTPASALPMPPSAASVLARHNANRVKLQLAKNKAAACSSSEAAVPTAAVAAAPLDPVYTCLLCCNDFVQYIAVGPCNHHICSLCMLRMRCKGSGYYTTRHCDSSPPSSLKCKRSFSTTGGNDSSDKFNNKILSDKNCTICKQAMEICIVYKVPSSGSSSAPSNVVRDFESFGVSDFTGGQLPGCVFDEKSGMLYVDCKAHVSLHCAH